MISIQVLGPEYILLLFWAMNEEELAKKTEDLEKREKIKKQEKELEKARKEVEKQLKLAKSGKMELEIGENSNINP